MPITAPIKWGKIKQKPTTVSGYGITDVMGSGQTWQDMTAQRVQSNSYVNNTGKTILVVVSITSAFTGGGATAKATVAGVDVATVSANESNGTGYQGLTNKLVFAVPDGAGYLVAPATNSISISKWVEFR